LESVKLKENVELPFVRFIGDRSMRDAGISLATFGTVIVGALFILAMLILLFGNFVLIMNTMDIL